MNRGKIIGAIVLVVAIGLVLAQLLYAPEEGVTNGDQSVSAPTVAPEDSSGAARVTSGGAGVPEGAGGTVYRIDAAQSEVYWRIYKAGLLARFGHNHIISIRDFDGSITAGSDLSASRWDLSFRVADLVVDDPDIRARYGEDFESVPGENDIAGTKRNMLTEDVLDGDVYPEIRLSGTGFSGSADAATLPVTIELLGRRIEQAFPAAISIEADAITISGDYRLTHEDLGMAPFSAAGGALSVGDDIDFTYRIRAIAGGR